jgi:hypothetical protein
MYQVYDYRINDQQLPGNPLRLNTAMTWGKLKPTLISTLPISLSLKRATAMCTEMVKELQYTVWLHTEISTYTMDCNTVF